MLRVEIPLEALIKLFENCPDVILEAGKSGTSFADNGTEVGERPMYHYDTSVNNCKTTARYLSCYLIELEFYLKFVKLFLEFLL